MALAPGGRQRPSLLVALAAVAGALLCARLGWWQLDRAQQKVDLQQQIDQRGSQAALPQGDLARDQAQASLQWQRTVQLRGRWLAKHTIYLDNRQMNGRPGFFVLTPLLLSPGDAVVVQRGWLPRDFQDRSRLTPVATPDGEVVLTGRIAPPPSKLFAMGSTDTGLIRQNLDLPAWSQELGLALRPVSVLQTDPDDGANKPAASASSAGLLRQWPAPALGVGKHHGYAFQWFAFAALIAGLYVWFQIIRPRRHAKPDASS